MRNRAIKKTTRTAFIAVAVLLVQHSGMSQIVPEISREPVPDHLAWRMFHESLASYQQQSAKLTAPSSEQTGQRTLFSSMPRSAFDEAMKRQFGLSPEQTAALLSVGRSYVVEMNRIYEEAKAEVDRRYRTPTPPPP